MRRFLIILLLFFMMPIGLLAKSSSDGESIAELKKKIIILSQSYQRSLSQNELRNNNKLARYQAKLLIKVFAYEIYIRLKKQGVTGVNKYQIEQMAQAAYDCAWVFQDLGNDHIERFILIMQWAKEESNYKKGLICHWKAGTYLPSIGKRVLKDATDYGAWQINEDNLNYVKLLNYLYDSGVITFRIKRVRRMNDVMDIPTNAAARCLIETDRKSRGWEWRHVRDKQFMTFLYSIFYKLEKEGLYDRRLVERYYKTSPYKKYSYARLRRK